LPSWRGTSGRRRTTWLSGQLSRTRWEALRRGARQVDLRTDSQLVARQISGRYRVKHPNLKPIHARVMALLAQFEAYTVGHVPRERNQEADRLSNVAIDRRV